MIITVVVILLIILVLLMIAPIKVKVKYKDAELNLAVFIYGLKVFSLKRKEKKPPEEIEKKADKFEKDTKSLSQKLSKIVEICKTAAHLIKKYVSVTLAEVRIKIGMGDAAITAVSTGALWAAVYNLLGKVGRIVYIKRHDVEIVPDYSNSIFESEAECIIKSHLAYIIIIAATILKKINSRKGKEE